MRWRNVAVLPIPSSPVIMPTTPCNLMHDVSTSVTGCRKISAVIEEIILCILSHPVTVAEWCPANVVFQFLPHTKKIPGSWGVADG